MFVLGVTGASGAGKTTIVKQLALYGFKHIDTDVIARKIIPVALDSLVDTFGADIITGNNELDRKILAEKAFSSKKNTEKLNKITHPLIIAEIKREIEAEAKLGTTLIAVDGAALFEAGADKLCNKTVAVCADTGIRLKRVILRDNITEDQAKQRFRAQKSQNYYTEKCDYTIFNNTENEMRQNTEELLQKLNIGGISK